MKNYIEQHEPVKVGDISKFLDQISINTIKKDLQYLNKEGVIEKIGKGRGTVYVSKLKKK